MHFPRIGSGKQPGNRDPVNNSNQSAPKKGRRGRRNSFHPNIQLPFEKIKPLTDLLPSAIDTDRTDSEGSSGSNTPVSQHLIQREELDTIVFDQCFTKSINSDILELLSKYVEGSFNEFEFKNHYRDRFNQFLDGNKDTLFEIASEAGILDPLELSAFILVMLVKADNRVLEDLPNDLYLNPPKFLNIEKDPEKFKRYVSFEKKIVLKGYAAKSIVPLQDPPVPSDNNFLGPQFPPI